MRQYVVDAFTSEVFKGNPAAICVLDKWLPEDLMTSITLENRLSETAFTVREGDAWHLRWFTTAGEINLCGHATLATAYVLMSFYGEKGPVRFSTLGGALEVRQGGGGMLKMDFPAYALREVPVADKIEKAMGARPARAFMGRDLLCVFDSASTIRALDPRDGDLLGLDGLLVHATAHGDDGTPYDCVSRSFGPKCGVHEDPVCGSGHCHIAPYWSGELKKPEILAWQASRRGGELRCRVEGGRVIIAGKAALYAKSEILPGLSKELK